MSTASLYTLDELPTDSPMPRLSRKRIFGDRMMISRLTLEPGFDIDVHQHENEQIVVVLSGRAEFTIREPGGSRTLEATTGQVLVIAGNVPHGCRAIERCEFLDVFSPVSEKTGVDEG